MLGDRDADVKHFVCMLDNMHARPGNANLVVGVTRNRLIYYVTAFVTKTRSLRAGVRAPELAKEGTGMVDELIDTFLTL